MRVVVSTVKGPSKWARYFINFDTTGLTPDERREADDWVTANLAGAHIEDVERDAAGKVIPAIKGVVNYVVHRWQI